jgi:hypothetical protein
VVLDAGANDLAPVQVFRADEADDGVDAQRRADAKAAVRGFGPADRLEHEVDRGAALDPGRRSKWTLIP